MFLALLPNIRHNCLKTLGEHLSRRVKRLQGIPPPDLSVGAPRKGGQARRWQRGAPALKTEEERQAEEDEEARRRARVLDDGWTEGPLFQNVDDDAVGVLAGCSASTFRRRAAVFIVVSACRPPLVGHLFHWRGPCTRKRNAECRSRNLVSLYPCYYCRTLRRRPTV